MWITGFSLLRRFDAGSPKSIWHECEGKIEGGKHRLAPLHVKSRKQVFQSVMVAGAELNLDQTGAMSTVAKKSFLSKLVNLHQLQQLQAVNCMTLDDSMDRRAIQ